jgi:hypothetical protein
VVKIFYRPAEVIEGRWQLVGEVPSLDDARDELASWQGPRLGHGDLVVVGTKVPTLFVFDGARGALAEVGGAPKTGWVSYWEGKAANAASLFRRCDAVDRRRIALAACAVAESSLKYGPAGEDRPRLAIEAARRGALGGGNAEELRDARQAVSYVSTLGAILLADAAYAVISIVMDDRRGNTVATAQAESAVYSAAQAYVENTGELGAQRARHREMAPMVRRYIPLSVLACSLVGARDPLPMPRENPSRALGWIANPTRRVSRNTRRR